MSDHNGAIMKKRYTVVVERPSRAIGHGLGATYVACVEATTVQNAIRMGQLEAMKAAKAANKLTNEKEWRVLVVFTGHQTIEYQL